MASASPAGPATTPNGACIAVKVVMISRQICSTVASGSSPVCRMHEAAHHVGLAVGAESGAGLARALDLDQLGDDARAVDQKPVHGLVDRIDAVADCPAADRAPACPFALASSHVRFERPRALAAAPAERKENIEASRTRHRAAFTLQRGRQTPRH